MPNVKCRISRGNRIDNLRTFTLEAERVILSEMKNDAAKNDILGKHMRDVDRTLLRENLKLTPSQRLEKFIKFMRFTTELRHAGEKARQDTVATKER